MKPGILVIDDTAIHREGLTRALQAKLGDEVDIVGWSPQGENPHEKFKQLLADHCIRLVVTDYDLTSQGTLGLFGATVVDWCQLNALPVGDFSRMNFEALAKEPNLFELRIPIESFDVAAEFTGEIFLGFEAVRAAVEHRPELSEQRSPAAALAFLLDTPHLVSQFAQYGVRYGSANASLVDVFRRPAEDDAKRRQERAAVLVYILGHLLYNGVLRFPGPILSRRAIAAYLAVAVEEIDALAGHFTDALYAGPFAALGPYWWTERIDAILDEWRGSLAEDMEFDSPGGERRALAQAIIGRDLAWDSHCERCHGERGGFLCPYTRVTVCQLSECSVSSNIWIPPGARMSRFERDFYDEWAPILGM